MTFPSGMRIVPAVIRIRPKAKPKPTASVPDHAIPTEVESLTASATSSSEAALVQRYPAQQCAATAHYDLTATDYDDNYATTNLLFNWNLHDEETDNDSN